MSPTDTFLNATDRRGNPLFPSAYIVAEHGSLALVDWQPPGNSGLHSRTVIDNFHETMRPGIYGTAEHVHDWLVRQSHRSISSISTRGI